MKRLFVQLLILIAFLWLIFSDPVKHSLKLDFFCRVDPLLALTALISSRSFFIYSLTSLGIIIFTILFGRFFCGWICPMGTLSERISRKTEKATFNFSRFKYYILIFIVFAAFFGFNAAYIFDPFAILTRGLAMGVYPILQLSSRFISESLYKVSLGGNEKISDLAYSLSDRLNSSHILSSGQMPLDLFAVASLIILAVIIGLSFIQKRFWCRNICPLGAFLGLLSRYSIFKRAVESSCIKCKKCIKSCQMGAIDKADPYKTENSECVNCLDCQVVCPKDSICFNSKTPSSPDLDKRRLLIGAGAGVLTAGIANIDKFGIIKKENKNPLRPPGALSESKFNSRCVRCASCIKSCPTNALHPALMEAGTQGILTPVMVPRKGYCKENCNTCSTVCPTEAITPFEIEDKKTIRIGKAHVLKDKCLAWSHNKYCLICEEYCSYVAIRHERVKDTDAPIVDENICVGCGQCENICPVKGSAIIIEPLVS